MGDQNRRLSMYLDTPSHDHTHRSSVLGTGTNTHTPNHSRSRRFSRSSFRNSTASNSTAANSRRSSTSRDSEFEFRDALDKLSHPRDILTRLRRQSTATPRDKTYRLLIPRSVRSRISCKWSRTCAETSLRTPRGGMKHVIASPKRKASVYSVDRDAQSTVFGEGRTHRSDFISEELLAALDRNTTPLGTHRGGFCVSRPSGDEAPSRKPFHHAPLSLSTRPSSRIPQHVRVRAYRSRTALVTSKRNAKDFSKSKNLSTKQEFWRSKPQAKSNQILEEDSQFFDFSGFPALQEARSKSTAFASSLEESAGYLSNLESSPSLKPSTSRSHLLLPRRPVAGSAPDPTQLSSRAVGFLRFCVGILQKSATRRTVSEKEMLFMWLSNSVPFLTRLVSEDHKRQILDQMFSRKLLAGRVVYERDSRGAEVFFVVSGRLVSIGKHAATSTELRPGDVFGEPPPPEEEQPVKIGRWRTLVRSKVLPTRSSRSNTGRSYRSQTQSHKPRRCGSAMFNALMVRRATTVSVVDEAIVLVIKWAVLDQVIKEDEKLRALRASTTRKKATADGGDGD